MRIPRVLAVLTGSVLALTALAAPGPAAAERGTPGTWTKITTGKVINIAEPGLLRTADGVLHVVYHRGNYSTDDLAFTTISSTGKVLATGDAVTGWASLPQDPKLVSAPGGGIRLLFAGMQDIDVSNPYSTGQFFSATSDATGSAWTLQPGALSDSGYGQASYGTGATTLADGTPMVSFPLNSTLTWNAGGSAVDSTYDFGDCCAYNTTLAREGDGVTVAWSANGDTDATSGVFVKQLLPAVGPTVKAPQSTTKGDFVMSSRSTPFVARPGGGLYAAYCLGYPTCKVGVWKVGAAKPVVVPGSNDARQYAMGVAPGGRLWVAWSVANSNLVRFTHTGTSGTGFGAVTTIKPPKGATVYGISVAPSDGSADLVVADGSSMFHQQVLPGLSLKASPAKWKKAKKQKVLFTVRDAGVAVAGAKVKAGGASCRTAKTGRCTITFAPSKKAKRIWATARHAGYGAAKVRLKAS